MHGHMNVKLETCKFIVLQSSLLHVSAIYSDHLQEKVL